MQASFAPPHQPLAPPGEQILLSVRPSPWLILLYHLRRNLSILGLLIFVPWALRSVGANLRVNPDAFGWAFASLLAGLLAIDALEWASRRYVLTDRRILRQRGILTRTISDVPLERVQDIGVVRTLPERVLGLGSIGVSTAGGPMVPSWWLFVSRPGECLDRIRQAVSAVRGRPEPPRETEPPGGGEVVAPVRAPATLSGSEGFLVVGLVGGIGSGKSEVARLMAEHGYVVVDSDAEARACLDRPEVRDRLVEWWGRGVLDAQGRIDRRAVAEIVFGSPKERARLEALVHPLVRRRRAEMKESARLARARGVVVDAPLLLEAGADAECDVLVFVDAPREQRLERVRASRGWDEAQLSRREAAQMPLEQKRRRCGFVLSNDAGLEALRARVRRLVEALARGERGGNVRIG